MPIFPFDVWDKLWVFNRPVPEVFINLIFDRQVTSEIFPSSGRSGGHSCVHKKHVLFRLRTILPNLMHVIKQMTFADLQFVYLLSFIGAPDDDFAIWVVVISVHVKYLLFPQGFDSSVGPSPLRSGLRFA